jgi:hypothetical protein
MTKGKNESQRSIDEMKLDKREESKEFEAHK